MQIQIKKRYTALLLFLLLVVIANSCVTLRKSDKSILKSFTKNGQSIYVQRDTSDGISMRYVCSSLYDSAQPTVIFVHGAPGSSDDFSKYMGDVELRDKANLVSVDRLGYGFSDFGKATTSIAAQAQAIENIARKYETTKTVLVGWSYGGPIIGEMAMSNPHYTHLVMIAPAVSPEDEVHFWVGYLAKWKLTRWMVPKPFVVAEDEKNTHPAELRLLADKWERLTTPTTHFHGTSDFLVPYENLTYLQSKMDSSILKCVTLENENHFIPFTQFDLIKREILEIINSKNSPSE